MDGVPGIRVQTEVRGAVPGDAIDLAVGKVRLALQAAHEPVLFARVRLTMAADPAVERPAIAQANIDLSGRLIRAQATAATMRQAIDLMHDRLRVRLEHAARNWEAIRGRAPTAIPHEWRHQSPHPHRPPYLPRPPEERTVVRHKSYALRRHTPQDAVADMELLDYDFHLFTEHETGQDSVVYRSGAGYRLAQVDPDPRRLGPLDASIAVSEVPAPVLTLTQATAHLESLGRPFLFFVDEATGRGDLIYHRYDGHYGLITPADA
jgi:hypothetical protein